ncbi:MAG: hypothetical protein NVV70_03750 [Cellulomonas sp.]|nr:hypothetical protein [Cellulomonas sp.]MCR6647282.1 hypothetical protein [Cellulomonas sp.]
MNVYEYQEENTGSTKDHTANTPDEIHESRWTSYKAQTTMLETLPMSRSQLNEHLAVLRGWGDITTADELKTVYGVGVAEHRILHREKAQATLDATCERAESALTGRTLPPIHVVGATLRNPRKVPKAGTQEAKDSRYRYQIDEVVHPQSAAEAVSALVHKVEAAYVGTWRDNQGEPKKEPTWVPAPDVTAELVERALAGYLERTRLTGDDVQLAQVVELRPPVDEDVVDAELEDDEADAGLAALEAAQA